MKTIGKDGILLRLAKDMYPEKDDLSSIEVKTLFNDICDQNLKQYQMGLFPLSQQEATWILICEF